MGKMDIHWDVNALKKAISESDDIRAEMCEITRKKAASANLMSASFRTQEFVDGETRARKGDKAPKYDWDVELHGPDRWPTGIVYTRNYAAMKDNMLHNTLLKA